MPRTRRAPIADPPFPPPPAGAVVVEIPALPPTLNALMRGTIRRRIRLGKAWRILVAVAAATLPRAAGKRRVTIRVTLGPKRRGADPDAYHKAVGDALVKCKMLVDDDRRGVEWAPVEYRRGPEDGTEIVLEDLR